MQKRGWPGTHRFKVEFIGANKQAVWSAPASPWGLSSFSVCYKLNSYEHVLSRFVWRAESLLLFHTHFSVRHYWLTPYSYSSPCSFVCECVRSSTPRWTYKIKIQRALRLLTRLRFLDCVFVGYTHAGLQFWQLVHPTTVSLAEESQRTMGPLSSMK